MLTEDEIDALRQLCRERMTPEERQAAYERDMADIKLRMAWMERLMAVSRDKPFPPGTVIPLRIGRNDAGKE